jgi:hypothetical protein
MMKRINYLWEWIKDELKVCSILFMMPFYIAYTKIKGGETLE